MSDGLRPSSSDSSTRPAATESGRRTCGPRTSSGLLCDPPSQGAKLATSWPQRKPLRQNSAPWAVILMSRDEDAAALDAYVARRLAEAPPLTKEQRSRLAALLAIGPNQREA